MVETGGAPTSVGSIVVVEVVWWVVVGVVVQPVPRTKPAPLKSMHSVCFIALDSFSSLVYVHLVD